GGDHDVRCPVGRTGRGAPLPALGRAAHPPAGSGSRQRTLGRRGARGYLRPGGESMPGAHAVRAEVVDSAAYTGTGAMRALAAETMNGRNGKAAHGSDPRSPPRQPGPLPSPPGCGAVRDRII